MLHRALRHFPLPHPAAAVLAHRPERHLPRAPLLRPRVQRGGGKGSTGVRGGPAAAAAVHREGQSLRTGGGTELDGFLASPETFAGTGCGSRTGSDDGCLGVVYVGWFSLFVGECEKGTQPFDYGSASALMKAFKVKGKHSLHKA